VVLPALLLGIVELVLRVAGYGFPTAFFRQIRIGTELYVVENDQFGLRFFPAEMARSPAPVVFSANKPPGAYRVFILGESAALGDPKPAYGVGRYLQVLLRERFPGVEFEVISAGVTAINSHAILPIARECARQQGDAWIVYMGNNEMVGPFGAMSVFGSRAPPLGFVRLSLAIQKTRLGQLLMSTVRKIARTSKPGDAWGGMKMWGENRVAPEDPRREVIYESFRRNLQDILKVGRDSGARILLSTVAVNLKDCAPFASFPGTNALANDASAFASLCAQGALAEARGSFAEAFEKFGKAAKAAPQAAEPQFGLGGCLLHMTGAPAALGHFQTACDLDALPFRADSRLNREIEQAGRQFVSPGLALFDAAKWFATNSPGGVPGQEWFYEHVHFNFDGNYRLARSWAEQLENLLPAALKNRAAGGWASQALCERRLGLTDWNRYAVLEEIEKRLTQPPFIGQSNHSNQVENVKNQMRELREHLDPAAAEKARNLCVEALQRGPQDHRLHESYAEFLEATGDLREAAKQWEQVSQLIPQHHLAYFQSGRLQARLGNLETAGPLLTHALTLRPDLAEGWLELGDLHALQKEPELALKDYERERRLAPQDYRIYYRIGKALSTLHRQNEAIGQYVHALQLNPRYWEARYALGEELAFAGQVAAARREFERVIGLHPGFAMAHLNLGVAMFQQGQLEDALREFEETISLDPKNKLANEYAAKLRSRKPPKR
jgi:tetratricopeptide (TPR) repeat protein